MFLLFIVRAPAMAGQPGRGDWLMRFSPYDGLGASVSAWELIVAFWPALVLLVGAVLLGRYFCGWLCPLGATLDGWDRLVSYWRGTERRGPPLEAGGADFEHVAARRLKYYLLAATAVAAFLGVSVFGLFDPLSIAVRSYVLAVHSYAARGLSALLNGLGLPRVADAVARALGVQSPPVFQLQYLTFLVLLGLLMLGLLRRRFWCRYLCPLGALYALAGKWALTRRKVTDACIECGRCAEACPMSCISPDGQRTLNGECVLCLQCQPVCPVSAVRFFGSAPPEQNREVDLTRRGALAAGVAGLLTYPVLRPTWAGLHAKTDPLIRPPLAGRDIDEFLSKCVRCGQCMRVCPYNVIQPAGLEAGLESLWTAKLDPRPGYCDYNCELCGQACPSGAIPAFTLEEKHRTAMGLAFVDRIRCIPWRGNQRWEEPGFVADQHNCGVCEEVCPVPGKAIHFRRVYPQAGRGRAQRPGRGRRQQPIDLSQELRLPYVRKEACVGCGYCESVCPVEGEAAIRVTGGFREIEPQEAAAEPPPTAEALPEKLGQLRLSGPKRTYQGAQELRDYINGGADPYLVFNFIRVTNANYTDGEHRVKADLWQFETAEDAFGAFAKDRQGEPAEIGDEGAALDSSLWTRHGAFMLSISAPEAVPKDQVRELARQTLAALEAEGRPRPEICRRLPEQNRRPMSVLFVRDAEPLRAVRLAGSSIPNDTWGFDGAAVGAYAAYQLGEARPEQAAPATGFGGAARRKVPGLVLIRHRGPAAAEEAARRLAELCRRRGGKQVKDAPRIFKMGAEDYCAIETEESHVAAAFAIPDAPAAASLLAEALK